MKLSQRQPIPPVLVSTSIALTVAGLLYGRVLSLPLFSDDLVQVPWLESISWRELWGSVSPYGYYRPLWYTIWRFWGTLTGGLNPPGLHLLNLIAHVLATVSVGLLAVAWIRPGASDRERVFAAGIASILFGLFPFSRQAVAWPGAVYNPIVSAMGAVAVLLYDRGRRGYGSWWTGGALILATLAPFIYESGMLVALLLGLVELTAWLRQRWSSRAWWAFLFVGLFLITFLFWRSMRGAGVALPGLTLADLSHNVAYLVQGLIYPLAPLAQILAEWTRLEPALALWLVALPIVILLAWKGARDSLDMLLLGGGWFGLFAIPPLVSMKADWFALAPRFLYMTAAGACLIWAAALSQSLAEVRSGRRLAFFGWAAVLLLAPAVLFVRSGLELYDMAGESIWDAAEVAAQAPSALLVNLPRRLTPSGRTYPLGFEGVTPLPMRVNAENLVYVHAGVPDAADAVGFGTVATDKPPSYSYDLFGRLVGWEGVADAARRAQNVYLTRYQPGRIHLVEAGGIAPSCDGREPLARFDDQVDLLDASSTCDGDGRVHLTTRWEIQSDIEADLSIFVHLLRADGTIVAQADGRPLLGMLPFWLWELDETVRDVRHFQRVASGEYVVRLGIWDPATGERWQTIGYPGGVVTLTVTCP